MFLSSFNILGSTRVNAIGNDTNYVKTVYMGGLMTDQLTSIIEFPSGLIGGIDQYDCVIRIWNYTTGAVVKQISDTDCNHRNTYYLYSLTYVNSSVVVSGSDTYFKVSI